MRKILLVIDMQNDFIFLSQEISKISRIKKKKFF